jgi:hypothetical protein
MLLECIEMLSPNKIEFPSLHARRGRESDIGITPNLNPDGFPIHSVFTCLPTDGFFMQSFWLLLRPPTWPQTVSLYTPSAVSSSLPAVPRCNWRGTEKVFPLFSVANYVTCKRVRVVEKVWDISPLSFSMLCSRDGELTETGK